MSEYNENALYYHEQVVILDTTNAGSTSGGLVVKGGISGKDTYITGHVAVNNVKITPNKNDIIFEQQAILDRSGTFTDITDFNFDDSIANSFKASAIADARAKWPIPTPLLVARIIVGFSITIGSLGDTPELLA